MADNEDIDAYSSERLAFYEALLAACDNEWLLWAWRLLYAQSMRYRHMFLPLAEFELGLDPHHESILKAVLARNVEKAEALSVQNYNMIIRFVESQTAANRGVVKPRAKRIAQVT